MSRDISLIKEIRNTDENFTLSCPLHRCVDSVGDESLHVGPQLADDLVDPLGPVGVGEVNPLGEVGHLQSRKGRNSQLYNYPQNLDVIRLLFLSLERTTVLVYVQG